MDSGCLEFDGDADDEIDVLGDLSPSQLIWTMDELLRREVVINQSLPHVPSLTSSGCMASWISAVSDAVHVHTPGQDPAARS